MEKISGFIIAKNEANRITLAINSIKNIVEELIVIDSGSTDATMKIAEDLGAKVIFNEWPGYVAQKAFAESKCKNNWVLSLDADEELSQDLQNEIEYIFASNEQDKYQAYAIQMVILHRLDQKPRFLAPCNTFIRIYNKNIASYRNSKNMSTHDVVLFNQGIDGKVYTLNSVAYHRSGTSIEQLVAKANFYSTEQANDLVKNDRNPARFRIMFEMLIYFFKIFFIRRYFVFGFDGFVDSVVLAFARFIRLAKARELWIRNNSTTNR